jgi:hypothetical protein
MWSLTPFAPHHYPHSIITATTLDRFQLIYLLLSIFTSLEGLRPQWDKTSMDVFFNIESKQYPIYGFLLLLNFMKGF